MIVRMSASVNGLRGFKGLQGCGCGCKGKPGGCGGRGVGDLIDTVIVDPISKLFGWDPQSVKADAQTNYGPMLKAENKQIAEVLGDRYVNTYYAGEAAANSNYTVPSTDSFPVVLLVAAGLGLVLLSR